MSRPYKLTRRQDMFCGAFILFVFVLFPLMVTRC